MRLPRPRAPSRTAREGFGVEAASAEPDCTARAPAFAETQVEITNAAMGDDRDVAHRALEAAHSPPREQRRDARERYGPPTAPCSVARVARPARVRPTGGAPRGGSIGAPRAG